MEKIDLIKDQEAKFYAKIEQDGRLGSLPDAIMDKVPDFLKMYVDTISFEIQDLAEAPLFANYSSLHNKATIGFSQGFISNQRSTNADLVDSFSAEEVEYLAHIIIHELQHAQIESILGESFRLTAQEKEELSESILSVEVVEGFLVNMGFRKDDESDGLFYPVDIDKNNWAQQRTLNHQLIYQCALAIDNPTLRQKYLFYCYRSGLEEQYLGILALVFDTFGAGKLDIAEYATSQYYLMPYGSKGYISDSTHQLSMAHAHRVLSQINKDAFDNFIEQMERDRSSGYWTISAEKTLINW